MAVGTDGQLSVTKDLGLKDYFTGQVPLQTGEIGDDFTYYLQYLSKYHLQLELGF